MVVLKQSKKQRAFEERMDLEAKKITTV